ncbi:MAG: phenylalanine--tRNA ligase subunit alpha [Maricaulis sp.]|jgi:phenylalanyl-tRNA synthetase alpha chain|nr:phenylalanine--tRNA ligase subunit alpha [Maricaulis sp.]HAQ34286.1 phenylalanine--tRNA ligase subunit alpha [Alphaproteobacteria bacterium]|tara:strand:+ start:269 stop:1351 length:1083 start_codon:yes stop_codon:yes gene_type:complete
MSGTDDIKALEAELTAAVAAAGDEAALETLRVEALGKKGRISLMMRSLGQMSPEERQVMGPALNGLKDRVADAIAAKKTALEAAALDARLATERADISLPPRPEPKGALHPVTQVMEELAVIFSDMGFAVAEGPDVEDDFHNFTALNFPEGHPARDTHDTFFFKPRADGSRMLLRTHTSPVQIRTLMNQKPPIRIIAPGRVYRCDWDQTHTPMFHQVEGLVIDKEAHMGHLKGLLMDFVAAFFETDEVEARFRPHHFPFTEPSAEMDVKYERVGDAVKVGSGDKWMEILGCGMVHPNVIAACGLDPDEYQGFAWGMGVDRLAMLKYGAPDLRDYFANDVRWLSHYGFSPLLQANLATGLS